VAAQDGTKHTSAHSWPVASRRPSTSRHSSCHSRTSATAALNAGVTSTPMANSMTPKPEWPSAQNCSSLWSSPARRGAQAHLRDALGQSLQALLQHPYGVKARRHIPVAKLRVQHDPLLVPV
jgi:hypothetical protein